MGEILIPAIRAGAVLWIPVEVSSEHGRLPGWGAQQCREPGRTVDKGCGVTLSNPDITSMTT